MKKMVYIGFSIFFLLYVVAVANAQYSIPDLVEIVKPSVVTIITYNKDNQPISQGSGFFIDSQHIVSNCHVFEGAIRAEAKLFNGNILSISGFIYQSFISDQIIVRVVTGQKNMDSFSFTKAMVRPGESIVVIGSPFGLEQSVSEGIISSIRQDKDSGELIQITAPISPGSSGSPVLNLKGELVGVATFQLVVGQNLNFAIPFKKPNNLHSLTIQPFSKIDKRTSDDTIPLDQQFLIAANLAFGESNYEVPLKYFEKSIEANPKNVEAYIGAGKCKWFLNDIKSAEDYFFRALKINPAKAVSYYKIAAFYHSVRSHPKEVQSLIQSASRLRLFSVDDHIGAGEELWKLGYRAKVDSLFDEAISISQNKLQTYLRLSMLFDSNNRLEKKIEMLERVLRIFPSSREQYNILAGKYLLILYKDKIHIYEEIAQTYDRLRRREKVKQTYERAVHERPETAEDYYILGNMFYELGQYRDAIASYKEAIRLDPNHFDAHYKIAELYKKLEFPNEAITFFRKAIIIDPDNYDVFSKLGFIYLEHGYYQESINAFKQLIRIAPELGSGYYCLGLAYLYSGEKGLALTQFEKLKKIDNELAKDLYERVSEQ